MIQLRYVGIPYESSQIPAVCISMDTEKDAIAIAESVRDYYETPGEKPIIEVSFNKNRDRNYDFHFILGGRGSVDVTGVSRDIPENIISALAEFNNYVILLGFTNDKGVFEILNPKIFHMVKRGLTIDGNFVMGEERIKVNWVSIFNNANK